MFCDKNILLGCKIKPVQIIDRPFKGIFFSRVLGRCGFKGVILKAAVDNIDFLSSY
jgi:hypothetical protein